jgi:hypothetical protein
VELKEELSKKLEEFIAPTDSLDEVFENREQIEISRFYERLPKPHSIAIAELRQQRLQIEARDLGAAAVTMKENSAPAGA